MSSTNDRRPLAMGVWAVSALAPAARVWGHGPSGRAGAVLILALAGALVVALVVDGVALPLRAGAVAVVGALGWVVITPLLGRAPWTFTVAAAPLAVVASGLRLAMSRSCWVNGPPAGASLAVLVLNGCLWAVWGRVDFALAGVAVAATLVVASFTRRPTVVAADRVVGRVAVRLSLPCRSLIRAVVAWWRRPSTSASRWAGTAAALASAPVFWRVASGPTVLVRGTNDFQQHVERAEALSLSPFFVSVPHPLWHLSFLAVRSATGRSLAIVLIGAVATGVLVGLIVSLGRGEWDHVGAMTPRVAGVFGVSYLVCENVAQLAPRGPAWWQRLDIVGLRARGSSFYPLHQWGSPTITLSLPLALLMVLLVLFTLRDDLERARRYRGALVVATVAATMTLPATTLALVPAVMVYLVLTRRLTRERLGVLGPYFVVPGVLCCVAQTAFLASGVSSFERTTWRWNPGWLIPYVGLDRPVFWLVLLVLPVGCWLCGQRLVRDPSVALSLVMLLIALGPALLLQQTAPDKAADGDLAMPALFAGIFLALFCTRFIVTELEAVWRRRREVPVSGSAVAASLLLALMVVAGLADLLSAAGVVPEF